MQFGAGARSFLASHWAWWAAALAAPATAGILVCLFAAAGLRSRSMESLQIVQNTRELSGTLALVWVCVVGLWVLSGLCAGVFAVLRPALRRPLALLVFASASVLIGYAVGIVLGLQIHERLRYRDEQAVEALIAEFDPVVHAIRKFEADHGQAPDTLIDLVPRYLPRIPQSEVLRTPIELRYERLDRDWRLQGEAYLMHGFAAMSPLLEIAYLGSQDYAHGVSAANTRLEEYDHSFRGWRWYIID